MGSADDSANVDTVPRSAVGAHFRIRDYVTSLPGIIRVSLVLIDLLAWICVISYKPGLGIGRANFYIFVTILALFADGILHILIFSRLCESVHSYGSFILLASVSCGPDRVGQIQLHGYLPVSSALLQLSATASTFTLTISNGKEQAARLRVRLERLNRSLPSTEAVCLPQTASQPQITKPGSPSPIPRSLPLPPRGEPSPRRSTAWPITRKQTKVTTQSWSR